MEFGERLKQARLSAGLTQEDVVRRVGVSRQTVSNWENNRSYPDLASVLKLSDLYGISLDDMLKEDMELRRKLEQRQADMKKYCSWVQDLGLLLMPVALVMGRFGKTEAGIALGVMGLMVFDAAHGLLVWRFRVDWKLLCLRTLAIGLWFAGAFLRISSGHTSGAGDLLLLAGLGLQAYVSHRLEKEAAFSKQNTMFTGFVVAVVVLLSATPWITDSVQKGEYNEANPFESRDYRVAKVLHGDVEDFPLVYLGGSNRVYLDYPGEEQEALGGQFTHITQPEGAERKGVWEMIPEEDAEKLYRVTVEADDSVILSCLDNGELQWEYLLEPAPAVGCTILDSLGVVTGAVDWYYKGGFDETDISSGFPLRGKGSVKLSVPGDSPTVTIYEEFRDGDSVEFEKMILTKDGRGFVEFKRETRQNGQEQTGIYRIPYEDGEFVLVLNFAK